MIENTSENTKLGIIYILGETLGKKKPLSPDVSDDIISNLISLSQDVSPKVASRAAEALGNLQSQPKEFIHETVSAALFSALNHNESTVKRAAVNALYKIKWDNLPKEIIQQLFSDWIQNLGDKTVARLLSLQSNLPEDIIEHLKDLLRSKDEMIRAAAAIALRGQHPVIASPMQAV